MSDKYMKVEKIDHGTVIDHILPARAFDVLRVLGLSNDKTMSILVNSHSKKGGRKDILKLEDVELSAEAANLVALVSPQATINIIVSARRSQRNIFSNELRELLNIILSFQDILRWIGGSGECDVRFGFCTQAHLPTGRLGFEQQM